MALGFSTITDFFSGGSRTPGQGYVSSLPSHKDLQNQRISDNILRKSAQLASDLETLRARDNAVASGTQDPLIALAAQRGSVFNSKI